jgi:chromosome partitioning protein
MAAGKLVLVCKLKGGAGATTTCRELAAAALADGRSVAIVDLDSQGSLTKWWNRRTATVVPGRANPELLQVTASQIPAVAAKLRKQYDLIIIDSPPSIHETIKAVAGAVDLALIPARPTTDDLDAVGPIARLLHGVVDLGFIQTQVPGKRSLDGAEALGLLAARAAVLGRTTFRSAYSRPPATGSTGYEEDHTAKEEIGEVYSRIRERLQMPEHSNHVSTQSGDSVKTGTESA